MLARLRHLSDTTESLRLTEKDCPDASLARRAERHLSEFDLKYRFRWAGTQNTA